jgi:hypothetical protein
LFTRPEVMGSNAMMKRFSDAINKQIYRVPATDKPKVAAIAGQVTAARDARAHMTDSKQVVKEDDQSVKEKEKDELPSTQPSSEVGLETDTTKKDDEPSIETIPPRDKKDDNMPSIRKKTQEQQVLAKSLDGQTIKQSDIQLTPEGGELTLSTVSSNIPDRLVWDNTGKVTFYHKNVPYFLKRDKKEKE